MLAASLLLCGCEDEAVPPPSHETEQRSNEVFGQEWMDLRSHEEPAKWLIDRQKYAEPEDNDLGRVRAVLTAAGRRFEESPRMIANRALQLQGMLDAMGEHRSAVALTRDLQRVLGDQTASPGFGNLGAYYINLRKSGLDRTETLQQLSNKYNGVVGPAK